MCHEGFKHVSLGKATLSQNMEASYSKKTHALPVVRSLFPPLKGDKFFG